MTVNFNNLLKEIQKEHSVEQTVNSNVLIIDGLNSYLRAFSVNPSMNDDGTHIGGIVGFLNTVAYAVRLLSPTRCVIVFDGKGGSQRRRKIYPEYKQNRKGLRVRLNRAYDFEDADEEHKNAMRQLIRIAEYLDFLPVTTIVIENVEGDDVMAYLANDIFKEKVTIMSTDADFIQLINDKVSVWSPTRKKLYTPSSVKEDYGVISDNHILFKIITGDKSDNVPGIKGIGEKTVHKNVAIICEDKKIDFDSFMEYIQKESENNKTLKTLSEKKDELIRNYKLMQLSTSNISGTSKSIIRELIDKPISIINQFQFKRLFLEDKMYSAIPNLNSWLLTNFNKLNIFALQTQGEK